MTFTAVVTAHAASPARIVTNLLRQTRRPDEFLVYVSDPSPAALSEIALLEDVPCFETFIVPNRDDYGHEKRAMGLERASGDVIGWFNHDDKYSPHYVERMLDEIALGNDVAFCVWSEGENMANASHAVEFRGCNSTSGNWIARTDLVRRVGYRSRHYSADADLINDVASLKPRIAKVREHLYFHNA